MLSQIACFHLLQKFFNFTDKTPILPLMNHGPLDEHTDRLCREVAILIMEIGDELQQDIERHFNLNALLRHSRRSILDYLVSF
ncbi:hypothetical protein Ciccas_005875 [Cichlidogyrus casuarinus]|uniref:Uncharacterized protein n=1 Tax=Cichlidogyrus casuarinus TaxID=1844966 RepID=A0ABD2Q7D9_9PLAT